MNSRLDKILAAKDIGAVDYDHEEAIEVSDSLEKFLDFSLINVGFSCIDVTTTLKSTIGASVRRSSGRRSGGRLLAMT